MFDCMMRTMRFFNIIFVVNRNKKRRKIKIIKENKKDIFQLFTRVIILNIAKYIFSNTIYNANKKKRNFKSNTRITHKNNN